MSYYRPTTADIRLAYISDRRLLNARAWDESEEAAIKRLGRQFDLWLVGMVSGE